MQRASAVLSHRAWSSGPPVRLSSGERVPASLPGRAYCTV